MAALQIYAVLPCLAPCCSDHVPYGRLPKSCTGSDRPVSMTVDVCCCDSSPCGKCQASSAERPKDCVSAGDVNVISWRAVVSHMLASGGDEGVLKVWDLRAFAEGKHLANFAHHRCVTVELLRRFPWCRVWLMRIDSRQITSAGLQQRLAV